MKITHTNGGIEQALLQLSSDENCISQSDMKRLEYLKSLPQNRVEVKETPTSILTNPPKTN